MAVVQKALVILGNGYWARCRKLFPMYLAKDGKKRRKIDLALSEPIMEEYGIKETTFIGDYPDEMVEILSEEYTHPCILIHCGFKGEVTRHMERNKELFGIISIYEKNEQANILNIAYLEEEIADLRSKTEKYLTKIASYQKIITQKREKEEDITKDESSE